MREFTYQGKRTYATFENATRAGRKLVGRFFKNDVPFTWTVAATVDGRFYPLAVVNSTNEHLAGPLAHAGFCVVN